MSSQGYARALEFHPQLSLYYILLISGLHFFALLALISLRNITHDAVLLIGAPIVVVSMIWALYRQARIMRIIWRGENQWQIGFTNGEIVEASLLASSVVWVCCVILNFEINTSSGRQRLGVVMLPGAVDDEIFRKLRVCLRKMLPEL
jgi:hypothetical protein